MTAFARRLQQASGLNKYLATLGAPGTYKPDATTTGWRRVRASLTNYTGDITVTSPGTIIEGLYITGRVRIQAANVIVRQCEIVGNGYTSGNTALVDCNSAACSNALIEDCELHQAVSTANVWHDSVIGHDYIAQRNYCYDVVDGFGVYNSSAPTASTNVQILANYVPQLSYFSSDQNHTDPVDGAGFHTSRTHNDCIQIQSGTGTQIIGNHFRGYINPSIGNPQVAANTQDPAMTSFHGTRYDYGPATYYPVMTGHVITLTPVLSAITNTICDKNWLFGGAGAIIVVSNNGAQPSNAGSFTNNRLGNDQHVPNTPIQCDNNMTGTVFNGNVHDADSSAVAVTYYTPGTL